MYSHWEKYVELKQGKADLSEAELEMMQDGEIRLDIPFFKRGMSNAIREQIEEDKESELTTAANYFTLLKILSSNAISAGSYIDLGCSGRRGGTVRGYVFSNFYGTRVYLCSIC